VSKKRHQSGGASTAGEVAKKLTGVWGILSRDNFDKLLYLSQQRDFFHNSTAR
jgi:hypothetical protein